MQGKMQERRGKRQAARIRNQGYAASCKCKIGEWPGRNVRHSGPPASFPVCPSVPRCLGVVAAVYQQPGNILATICCSSLEGVLQQLSRNLHAAHCDTQQTISSNSAAAWHQASNNLSTACQRQSCSGVMKIDQQSVSVLGRSRLQQSSTKRFLRTT